MPDLHELAAADSMARYLRARDLQWQIEGGLNVVEAWNRANAVIAYGKSGEISTNHKEEVGATFTARGQAASSALRDRKLVPQDRNLDVLGRRISRRELGPSEHPTHREVDQLQRHSPASSQLARVIATLTSPSGRRVGQGPLAASRLTCCLASGFSLDDFVGNGGLRRHGGKRLFARPWYRRRLIPAVPAGIPQ